MRKKTIVTSVTVLGSNDQTLPLCLWTDCGDSIDPNEFRYAQVIVNKMEIPERIPVSVQFGDGPPIPMGEVSL